VTPVPCNAWSDRRLCCISVRSEYNTDSSLCQKYSDFFFDGKIPWRTAEVLALADVLGQGDPRAGEGEAGPALQTAKAEEPAHVVQTNLFAIEKGPYA
jgi:hypothetical protein